MSIDFVEQGSEVVGTLGTFTLRALRWGSDPDGIRATISLDEGAITLWRDRVLLCSGASRKKFLKHCPAEIQSEIGTALIDLDNFLRQKDAKAQAGAENPEPQAVELPREVTLIEVHAAQQEVTSSPYSSDFLELCMAAVASEKFALRDGVKPSWLMGVGAPSSDKTETALSLSLSPEVYLLDTLTENSFISGYMNPDGSAPLDLLAELTGRCLLIKDYTTLFSLKDDIIKRIIGDLQSIYDGNFARFTGTRGRVNYETIFSHIGCITPLALSSHHRYMATIGGRFLFYRILPLTEEEKAEGFKIISESDDERVKKIQRLRKLASGYLHNKLAEDLPVIRETKEQTQIINNLAILLARGRAVIRTKKVDYEKDGKVRPYYETEEVQIEEPFRAALQLRTLGRSLAHVHSRNYITDHDLELLRRVVLSTMPVDRAEVLSLFQNPNFLSLDGALTRTLCADGIGKSRNRANQLLTELVRVGILQEEQKAGGSQEKFYKPWPTLAECICCPVLPLDHILDIDIGETKHATKGSSTGTTGGFERPPT
jgi:hypothetical protein